jgi:hypothetical protein
MEISAAPWIGTSHAQKGMCRQLRMTLSTVSANTDGARKGTNLFFTRVAMKPGAIKKIRTSRASLVAGMPSSYFFSPPFGGGGGGVLGGFGGVWVPFLTAITHPPFVHELETF